MARFNLDDYIDVAERIEQFYAEHPNGRITTDLLNVEGWNGKQTQFIVKALLIVPNEHGVAEVLATGLAEESFAASAKDGPNFTSALENAETSAIGRACANLGMARSREGKRQRPSRQEMEKVERGATPVPQLNGPQAILKAAVTNHFADPMARKAFMESVLQREVRGYSDILADECDPIMKALAQLQEQANV